MNNITAYGKTDIGLKRHRNEDSYAVEPDSGFFIIADGMGGHTTGDMASAMAVEIARDFIRKALTDSEITWPFGVDYSLPIEINMISSAIRLANRHIFNESKGMATTMVVLLIKDGKANVCHVGDSRLYRIRDNGIKQMTEDHSLVADELRQGTITREQARTHSLRHIVTRAIGVRADIKCDCAVEDIISKDMFLLCSDGLSGMLEDSEILSIIKETSDIKECCEKLIKKANEEGGNDNITVILVKCD